VSLSFTGYVINVASEVTHTNAKPLTTAVKELEGWYTGREYRVQGLVGFLQGS
jgi:hypothetical protein